MSGIETTQAHRPERKSWREWAHKVGEIFAAQLVASIALHWLYRRVQAHAPGLPDLQWVDSFVALTALTLVTLTLALACRAGASHETTAA